MKFRVLLTEYSSIYREFDFKNATDLDGTISLWLTTHNHKTKINKISEVHKMEFQDKDSKWRSCNLQAIKALSDEEAKLFWKQH